MAVKLETCDQRNVGSNGEPMWHAVPRTQHLSNVESLLTYLKLNYDELVPSSCTEFRIIDAEGKVMDDTMIRLRIGK